MASLVRADDTLVINRKNLKGLPLVLDRRKNVEWSASAFLRSKVLESGSTIASATTMASHLLQFLSFLETEDSQFGFCDTTDDLLMSFANDREGSATPQHINAIIGTVVGMLFWGQRNGYFEELVGVTDIGLKRVFPVTVQGKGYDPTTGRIIGNIKPIVGLSGRSQPSTSYPTEAAIDKLLDGLDVGDSHPMAAQLLERNSLIVEIGATTGLRAFEISGAIKVSSFPAREAVERFASEGREIPIRIVGKGGVERAPLFHPELVLSIQDFIEYTRPSFVARARSRAGKREPEEVFLSYKTGQKMKPSSISDLISDAAKRQGVEVTAHGLRRFSLSEIFYACLAAGMDEKTAYRVAAQMAGHKDITTTDRHYIDRNRKTLPGFNSDSDYMESKAVKILKARVKQLEKALRAKGK